jgi:hypothetical protein
MLQKVGQPASAPQAGILRHNRDLTLHAQIVVQSAYVRENARLCESDAKARDRWRSLWESESILRRGPNEP